MHSINNVITKTITHTNLSLIFKTNIANTTTIAKSLLKLLATGFMVAIMGCSYFNNNNAQLLATVANNNLTLTELAAVLPNNIKGKDSIEFVKQYVESWVREQLIVQKAIKNLSSDELNVDEQIENYKNSLIVYAYQQALIKQQLDTIVSPKEIEEYYTAHEQNFELKDNIIKVNYIRVSNKCPKLSEIKQLYRSNETKDLEKLKAICVQYADNYYFDNGTWLLFDDLLKEIPIKTYNQEQYIQNNRSVELRDSANSYFANIIGFKINNSISPLSFETENIKQILLNTRKLALIQRAEKTIYTEGIKNKEAIIISTK